MSKTLEPFHMYVECTSMLNNTPDNNLKQEVPCYELWDSMLYNSELNTPVIIMLDDLVATIELVHKVITGSGPGWMPSVNVMILPQTSGKREKWCWIHVFHVNYIRISQT